jgi:hypothetical protein
MSLRDRVLAGGAVPKDVVQVATPDGEQLTVEVRGLTQGARGRLMNTSMRTITDEDGEKKQELDIVKLQPTLLIECAYDPETGARLFQETDREALAEMSAAYLDPIITKASDLSGLGKDAVETAEGN